MNIPKLDILYKITISGILLAKNFYAICTDMEFEKYHMKWKREKK